MVVTSVSEDEVFFGFLISDFGDVEFEVNTF